MKNDGNGRYLPPLIGLTCSTFVFNTSEFVPIGLLTDIANEFGMTEAHAGMLISVYAWVVMLLSLPLMLSVSKVALKRLMMYVLLGFTAFQVLSSVSTGYAMLMFSRTGVACTHAIFWSIVSPLAVSIVPPQRKTLALSMIVTGTSIAMILGLPLGRIIGLQIGWRMTFLCIGIFSAIVLLYLLFALPSVPAHKGFSIKSLPTLLSNRALSGIYLLTFGFATSYYVGYSYIEPFLQQIAHLSADAITFTLMLFGIAGIIGSYLFSRFYQTNPVRFISTALSGITVCLMLLMPIARFGWPVITLCGVWGMAGTAYNVSFQNEIINLTDENATPVAMSISSGIFNMGIAIGTMIGGSVCTHSSIGNIGYTGGVIALCTLLFWITILSRQIQKNHAI